MESIDNYHWFLLQYINTERRQQKGLDISGLFRTSIVVLNLRFKIIPLATGSQSLETSAGSAFGIEYVTGKRLATARCQIESQGCDVRFIGNAGAA